jgi:hypothetical protein
VAAYPVRNVRAGESPPAAGVGEEGGGEGSAGTIGAVTVDIGASFGRSRTPGTRRMLTSAKRPVKRRG